MKIVGLTGSIGMGKTTTAQMFRARGVPVFDADGAVRALQSRGGVALPAIEAAFPGAVEDDVLNRVMLRNHVFEEPEARQVLESIIHPMVSDLRRKFLADAEQDKQPFVVLDVPLLYETGGDAACDFVLVVSAPEDVQRARVLDRPGMDEDIFNQVVASQLPDADKRARADYVIETGGGTTATELEVEAVIRDLHARSAAADQAQENTG